MAVPATLKRDAQSATHRHIARIEFRFRPVVSGLEHGTVAAGDRKVRIHAGGDAPGLLRVLAIGREAVHAEAGEEAAGAERLVELVLDHDIEMRDLSILDVPAERGNRARHYGVRI